MIRILCYGDSNTYGFDPTRPDARYPEEILWTTLLAKRLGEEYEILNFGLNGRTTAYDRPDKEGKNGLLGLRPALETALPCDWLVIMLGTNDCSRSLGLSPQEITDGLEVLILAAKKHLRDLGAKLPHLLLIAPAPILPELAGTPFEDDLDETSVESSRALAPLYRELAESYGALFLDAAGCEVSPLDCEHLTEAGHRELAERICALLREN